MGQEVLDVNVTVDGAGTDVHGSLHIYAHCSARRSARPGDRITVTMLFVNIDENRSFSIMPTQGGEGTFDAGDRLEYHITSSTLLNSTVNLNGKALVVKDAKVPINDLKPIIVDSLKPIEVAPLSYGFAVLTGVDCPGSNIIFESFV